MRTTLTIEGDVAAQIDRLRREGDASLKDIVNEALRLGLVQMSKPKKQRKVFQTRPSAMGRPIIDIDNVAEALALAEGESYK
jgi:hypothetical protein